MGIDIDPLCQYPFEENNPDSKFLCENIEKITSSQLMGFWTSKGKRLLAGCAPCQPFSTYSQRKSASEDSRWGLLSHFGRLISETKPDYVTMENVPRLAKMQVFEQFVTSLIALGYTTSYQTIDCSYLGIPQKRKRLVLCASLSGESPDLNILPLANVSKVRDAIESLPEISAGEQCKIDPFHRSSKLSMLNSKRISASKPNGTWHDWPRKLRSECHKKETGDGYTAVYGRMAWDVPAPTITTQCYNYGSGRFGHPEQNRAISLREAAVLQSFPKDYIFEHPENTLTTRDAARLIGNAVPPKLGEEIAKLFSNLKE